jgi:tetratricopeptide (TPR) repeat protein
MSFKGAFHVFFLFLILFSSGCASFRGTRKGLEQPLSYEDGILILDVQASKKASPLQPFKALAKYWRLSSTDLLRLRSLAEHPELLAHEKADLLLQSLAESGLFIHAAPLTNGAIIERLTYGVPVLAVTATELLSPSSVSWRLVYGHSKQDGWKAAGINSRDWIPDKTFSDWRQNALNLVIIVCPEDAVSWPLSNDEAYAFARHFELKEEWDKALEVWGGIVRSSSLSDDWVNQGNAARKAGLDELARDAYEKAIELNPSNPAPYNNIAFLFLEHDQSPETALNYIQKAIAVDNRDPRYLDTRGYAYIKLGEFEKAAKDLEKARSRSKHLPYEERIEIHQRLLESYQAQGLDHLVRQIEKQIETLKNNAERLEKAVKN